MNKQMYTGKRIMSIDVGIKNLALCVLDISRTCLTLVAWEVLDLVPSISCEKCKTSAVFHKHKHYLCRTHAKQTLIEGRQYAIPTKTMDVSALPKQTKASLIALIKRSYPPTSLDTVTLQDIQKYKKDELIQYITSRMPPMYDRVKQNKTCEISFAEYGKAIVDQLDPFGKVDAVLIENQISPIANRMKTIQGMLTQYFVMRDVPVIEYISSSNKLKVQQWITHPLNEDICETTRMTGGVRSTYSTRKKDGISLTYHLLHHPHVSISSTTTLDIIYPPSTHHHFDTHKKKDDLADALLQGIWWSVVNHEMR